MGRVRLAASIANQRGRDLSSISGSGACGRSLPRGSLPSLPTVRKIALLNSHQALTNRLAEAAEHLVVQWDGQPAADELDGDLELVPAGPRLSAT